MTGEVVALVNDAVVGRLSRESGRYLLRYEDAWREAPTALPLSLSLPLSAPEHGDARVRPYLWNLLPDSDTIVRSWARDFGVPHNDPLAILSHVGEDCPGAVRLVAPGRVPELLDAARPPDDIEWLTDEDVGERLARVRDEPAAWREPGDPGQFSLAGAQPKIALLHDGERWGVPSGRTPTTHILKPPVLRRFDGFAENEHACVTLAARLGIPAVRSEVRSFGGQTAIVVERYDRARTAKGLVRLHQEDLCQALGVDPRSKYQADGGPGPGDIVRVLQAYSADPEADVATFVGALALNWAVGGTDAHAKNYALLVQPGGGVRMAPVYDVISLLPYPEGRGPRVKLAMKIGGEYRLRLVRRRNWERLAAEIGADGDALLALVRGVVERVPDVLAEVCAAAAADGVSHPVLERIQREVAGHVRSCLASLDDPTPAPAVATAD